MKKYYNPKRWSLKYTLSVVKNLGRNIRNSELYSKYWFYYKFKKEVEHTKKHLILMEMLLDEFKKKNNL